MRMTIVLVSMLSAALGGCQSKVSGEQTVGRHTAMDYRNAKPMTPEEEAKFVALGERQRRLAPLYAASSLDPTGLSQNAVQARSRADMMEMNRMMPAVHATNKKRATEWCATRQQTKECLELARLQAEARSKGVDY